jgi:hypothetical protein
VGVLVLLVPLLALAGPQPEGLDLDDLDSWEQAAQAVLDGPAGCWSFTGNLRQELVVYTPPSRLFGAHDVRAVFEGPFEGRLRDGNWERFEYEVTSDDEDWGSLESPIYPLLGTIDQDIVNREKRPEPEEDSGEPDEEGWVRSRMDGKDVYERHVTNPDGSESVQVKTEETVTSLSLGSGGISLSSTGLQPTNLVRSAVDEWAGDMATSLAEWNQAEDGVMLRKEVPLRNERRSPPVKVDTFFPGGGKLPTRLDAEWPESFKVGKKWPLRATLRNTAMHVRTHLHEGVALPLAESAATVGASFGFTVGYEQRIQYQTAVRCAE